MRIFYDPDNIESLGRPVVTVGAFDGVHAGHGILLDTVKRLAAELHEQSVVITFEPHPRIALGTDSGLSLLTTVGEKAMLLERAGIDNLVVAPFDKQFAGQTYAEFIERFMVGKLHIGGLVVGYNHRFGRDNEGNYDTLAPLAERYGFAVRRVDQYRDDDDKVSSTVIRALVAEGHMKRAARMLAHPYAVAGTAVDGRITVDNPYKLLPPAGRYDVAIGGRRTTASVDGRVILTDIPDSDAVIEFI